MKIAVTGGSGFLGREIVQHLLEAGHNVIALSRGQTTRVDFPKSVKFERADINDGARLRIIFSGCDCVVHCAALSAPWGKRSEFLLQNVEGTQSVVRACEAASVRRLIHVSSSSVYFSYADKLNISETSALPSPVNVYAESKQKAETEAGKFVGQLFIMRPRGIYGPGDGHLLPRLLRVMTSKPLPLLRNGQALVDITDVSVAAEAVVAMVTAPAAQAGTYNISHGEPLCIRELVERIGDGLGIKYQWRALPVGVAFAGARLLEAAARLDPWQREPLVTAYGLGLFGYSHTLDIAKARQHMKWAPKLSLDEGLARTFAHIREGAA